MMLDILLDIMGDAVGDMMEDALAVIIELDSSRVTDISLVLFSVLKERKKERGNKREKRN